MAGENCGTCKYWGEDANAQPDLASQGFGACEGILHPGYHELRISDMAAFVQDAEDFTATLYTRNTFSCALWEAGKS